MKQLTDEDAQVAEDVLREKYSPVKPYRYSWRVFADRFEFLAELTNAKGERVMHTLPPLDNNAAAWPIIVDDLFLQLEKQRGRMTIKGDPGVHGRDLDFWDAFGARVADALRRGHGRYGMPEQLQADAIRLLAATELADVTFERDPDLFIGQGRGIGQVRRSAPIRIQLTGHMRGDVDAVAADLARPRVRRFTED